MKTLIHFFYFALCLTACSEQPQTKTPAPYKRVVVFSGGGYEFAQFLGMMEALEEANKKPDLIIATCGGGLAAAIVANLPTSELRREFVLSPRFKELLRSSTPVSKVDSMFALYSWYMGRQQEAESRLVPNIFNEYLVSLPNELSITEFNKPFSSAAIPVIIIAGKVLFTPENVGKPITQKLYREILFTSPEVAQHLAQRKSPTGQMSGSSIESDAQVVTELSLTEAARAAIASPFMMPPTQIKGEYYVGGQIDLYPLELAHFLGDEVIMSFSDGYSETGTGKVIKAGYQFNANSRLQGIHEMTATHWIDFTDRDSFLKKNNGLGLREGGMQLSFRMPSDDQVFTQDVLAHFNYGKERTRESLSRGLNSKCHMRTMDNKNASAQLRQSCGRN